MTMFKITHQVVIESDAATVYNAITSQAGLAQWWIADCTAKPEEGFINEFRIEGHGTTTMKVTELEPNHRVEWECQDDGEWSKTMIRFVIREKECACTLLFEQEGWPQQSEFFATCSYHWARHLTMLAKYCETGQNQVDRSFELNEVRKVMSN